MLIRKKSLKIQERLGMRMGLAYGVHKKPVVATLSDVLYTMNELYKIGFRALLLPSEMFKKVGSISDLYKEHYTNLLKIKTMASKYSIELGIHASNLPPDPQLDEALKIYCNIASVMDARVLVIHPTFYPQMPPDQALKLVVHKINEIVNEVRVKAKIGIETTGRVSELGSVEDVLEIVSRTTKTEPVLNWAHIHGRHAGYFTSEADFRQIIDKTRRSAGHPWLSDAYFIFSGASYTPSGIIRHTPVKNSDMKLEQLIKTIQSFNMKGTLIFETPNRENDILDILEDLADMVR